METEAGLKVPRAGGRQSEFRIQPSGRLVSRISSAGVREERAIAITASITSQRAMKVMAPPTERRVLLLSRQKKEGLLDVSQ